MVSENVFETPACPSASCCCFRVCITVLTRTYPIRVPVLGRTSFSSMCLINSPNTTIETFISDADFSDTATCPNRSTHGYASDCLVCGLFRDGVSFPVRPPSWHRLGPRDMSFEAKRSRHIAVAVPELRVSRGIAVCPCQQRPQPQQPDLAYHQTLIGWRGRQPLDRGFGFGYVTVGAAVEQRFHQNTRRWNAPQQQSSCAEQMVDGGAHERYRVIAVSTSSPFTCQVDLDDRQIA